VASTARRLLAECLGTGVLTTVVVGSGIAAQRLSPDDVGLQLLESSVATALGLAAVILMVGPVSGAHLNPVVSACACTLGRRGRHGLSVAAAGGYAVAQLTGAVGGALLANAMYDVPIALATTERSGAGLWLGEVVATAGLVLLVAALVRTGRAALAAPAVAAFANPAVTVGRMFTDTFAGIAPASVLPFVAAQVAGGALGAIVARVLYPVEGDVS
jgi:glycerol uptake facilitator-like aquaporin